MPNSALFISADFILYMDYYTGGKHLPESGEAMRRYHANPIITRSDIPDIPPQLVDVTSVFNPGAVKFKDKYLLILRVQNRGRETFLLKAVSENGIDFEIDNSILKLRGIEKVNETIYHIYDPRITRLENSYYLLFAMDLNSGCRLGLARTEDFCEYEFLGIVSENDVRNGALFPEKIGGKYIRLDRPNQVALPGGVISGATIRLSESSDLLEWTPGAAVMSGRPHFWDELIGSGPPPVKTREGWLHVYHGIATHFAGANIYQAGVVLLDLEDPSKIIARGRHNILEPRENYELIGQVPNVVFPSGMIALDYDRDGFAERGSSVFIYYGAADTSVCLAMTTIRELIGACYEGNEHAA
jgi:beta-1,4-mannooligosaccharide/beta-1,4-mannosyl-N-acetylglucosamine phosphorylase